jgi:hypothetical protein
LSLEALSHPPSLRAWRPKDHKREIARVLRPLERLLVALG